MGDDITYLDLLILKKLDSESTVEKFGMKINTSFFDAANLIGSMKIKGLVDIEASITGQAPITITGEGKDLVSAAIQKAGEPIDSLDQTILNALVSGVRDLIALQKVINIRSKDLAFHLYKLKAYDYIDQTVQSAKVEFSLTEKGFLLTKGYRSSIKASEAAKAQEQAQSEAKPQVQAQGSAPVKKFASIEEEIRDLFNFKTFSSKKDDKKQEQKPAQPKPQAVHSVQQKIRSAQEQKTQPPPPHIHDSLSPSAQNPPKTHQHQTPPGIMQTHIHPASIQNSKLPPFLQSRSEPKKQALDRQAMLFSKLEFYLQRYAVFAILILIMLALIFIAIIFVFFV